MYDVQMAALLYPQHVTTSSEVWQGTISLRTAPCRPDCPQTLRQAWCCQTPSLLRPMSLFQKPLRTTSGSTPTQWHHTTTARMRGPGEYA